MNWLVNQAFIACRLGLWFSVTLSSKPKKERSNTSVSALISPTPQELLPVSTFVDEISVLEVDKPKLIVSILKTETRF